MKTVNLKILSSPMTNCYISTSILGKIIREWEYGIFFFWPGSVPDLVLAEDWKNQCRKITYKMTEMYYLHLGFYLKTQVYETGIEIFYNVNPVLIPSTTSLKWLHLLTENKSRSWKPWRVTVGLESWFLSIIPHDLPIWILSLSLCANTPLWL